MKATIYCNKTFNKGEIKNLIQWFLINYGSIRTCKFVDELKILGFKHATKAGISLGIEDLKIPEHKEKLFEDTEKTINETQKELRNGNITLLNNTEKVRKSWNITNEITKDEIINNFKQKDLLNPIYMMTFSGARGNISQIRQIVGMRGLISDLKGDATDLPIKSCLKEGLNIIEYFISCYGSRKGLIDTALKTANSGYLTRKLIYASQNQIIKKPKCKSKRGIMILLNKKNKRFYNLSKEKMIGRVVAKNVKDPQTGKLLVSEGQDICDYVHKKIKDNNKVFIRSPLTCKLTTGVCQLCYGWNLGNGRLAELGESVGILASQSIGEPGTQLTMRTFHTGGVFAGETEKVIKAPHNGTIQYKTIEGGRKIKTKYGEKAYFTTEEKELIVKQNKNNISKICLPKYSYIFTKPNKKVFQKQILAEIPKFSKINNEIKEFKEIKTSISGQTYLEKKNKQKLWLLSGNILSYYSLRKGLKKEKILEKPYYYLDKRNVFSKEKSNKIYKKSILRLNFEKIHRAKYVCKEKIRIKEHYRINKKIDEEKKVYINKIRTQKTVINNNSLKIGQFKYTTNKNDSICSQVIQTTKDKIIIRKANPFLISSDCDKVIETDKLIKKNNTLFINLYKKQKTGDIVQGLPKIQQILEARKTTPTKSLHEKNENYFLKQKGRYDNKIAARKTTEKMQKHITSKVQKVYNGQGVKISDKHIEIIVKQMTCKSIVLEPGASNLIPSEIIETNKIEIMNKNIKEKIIYKPIILGITKLSISKESFIADAIFRETTKIITRSAIEGRVDWLYGLKENIILGNIIPTGTGYRKINI